MSRTQKPLIVKVGAIFTISLHTFVNVRINRAHRISKQLRMEEGNNKDRSLKFSLPYTLFGSPVPPSLISVLKF